MQKLMILQKTHAHKGSKPNEGIMIGKKHCLSTHKVQKGAMVRFSYVSSVLARGSCLGLIQNSSV